MGEVECEARPSDRKKVVILGGGPKPDRPGDRVRLLLLSRCYALTKAGYETIMINCKPRKRSAPIMTPPTGFTLNRSALNM